jgi:hypothetical protein
MKKIHLFTLILLPLLFSTCKRDNIKFENKNDGQIAADGELPEWAVQELDKIPSENVDTTGIILPGGTPLGSLSVGNNLGPKKTSLNSSRLTNALPISNAQKKDLIIGAMLKQGLHLVNKNNSIAPQEYLAYVFGSKDILEKHRSTKTCTDKLFGLDCSGMVYQMALNAGFELPHGTAEQTKPSSWVTALKSAKILGLGPKAYTKTELPKEKLQNGDFIYWVDKDGHVVHSGLVLQSNSKLLIFQSNGSGSSECKKKL